MKYVGFTIGDNTIVNIDYGNYTCHALGEEIDVRKEVQLKRIGKSLHVFDNTNEYEKSSCPTQTI